MTREVCERWRPGDRARAGRCRGALGPLLALSAACSPEAVTAPEMLEAVYQTSEQSQLLGLSLALLSVVADVELEGSSAELGAASRAEIAAGFACVEVGGAGATVELDFPGSGCVVLGREVAGRVTARWRRAGGVRVLDVALAGVKTAPQLTITGDLTAILEPGVGRWTVESTLDVSRPAGKALVFSAAEVELARPRRGGDDLAGTALLSADAWWSWVDQIGRWELEIRRWELTTSGQAPWAGMAVLDWSLTSRMQLEFEGRALGEPVDVWVAGGRRIRRLEVQPDGRVVDRGTL